MKRLKVAPYTHLLIVWTQIKELIKDVEEWINNQGPVSATEVYKHWKWKFMTCQKYSYY